MKRRILVLCLLLALVFMAIAVPAVAAVGNVFTSGKQLVDPNSYNRFCVGDTIDYK
jgi:hypothetical protein